VVVVRDASASCLPCTGCLISRDACEKPCTTPVRCSIGLDNPTPTREAFGVTRHRWRRIECSCHPRTRERVADRAALPGQ
jgi:hypothetical protein